jgi:hypothetical protein
MPRLARDMGISLKRLAQETAVVRDHARLDALAALLDDSEVRLRVKRRVGPALWAAVPAVLGALRDVLVHAMPPAPDPQAPETPKLQKVKKAR